MNVRLLIEAMIRQMTVLIAELATSRGLRAPLASIADQVFLELSRELDALGVSRGVSADMFGMALRTYLRRIRRHDESVTRRGTSLWEGILGFIGDRGVVSRDAVLAHFSRDDEGLVRSVLQDLTDSGLIFRSGMRAAAMYRSASPSDVGSAGSRSSPDAVDMLVWAIIRREGPLSAPNLGQRTALPDAELEDVLERLLAAGRVRRTGEVNATYLAESIVIPVEDRAGWEAAVYDHFHAVVKTIIAKLRQDDPARGSDDRVGGSTYGFEIWDGHPLAETVYGQLRALREQVSALRRQVDEFNAERGKPARFDRVTFYMGQCVIAEEGIE